MSANITNITDDEKFWKQNDPTDFVLADDISDRFSSLKPSTKIITLRVPAHLLTNLKLIANKRDIPYQSLLKVFLQEKVNEELQTPFLKLKRKTVRKTLSAAIVFFTAVSLTYSYLASPIHAEGTSMAPNYPNDTYFMLDKVAYTTNAPQRGDVVVFHSPSQPNSMYFKRIVGLPGEKMSIKSDGVYINDHKLYEPYAQGSTLSKNFPTTGSEVTIPGNSYYVLGDNRENSTDSRDFGFITKENITGKISACYWNCK